MSACSAATHFLLQRCSAGKSIYKCRRMICNVPWFSSLDYMGEIPWPILISILPRWVQYLGCGKDQPLGSRNGPSAIGPQLFGCRGILLYGIDNCYLHEIHGSPSVESNIAAKFSSAAAKINCGYNILAAKDFTAALQRKKLTFFTIPIYIYIYI